jgi:hypothetical protein
MALLDHDCYKPDQPLTRAYYIIGLDLGKSQDYTALAILETRDSPEGIGPDALFHCRHLQRFKLGTSYPRIVEIVRELCTREPLLTIKPQLGIDQTGVGAAVVDMFQRADIHADLRPIVIHGGDRSSNEEGVWRVPKRELVGVVQVALQTRTLKIAESLPDAGTLTRELQNFQVNISDNGFDSYNARVGTHDDLVLALAMALWIARNRLPYFGLLDHELAQELCDYRGRL